MDEQDVGSIVITDGAEPAGIVTDRELTVRVLGEEADPSGVTVENVMIDDGCTVDRTAGFYQAAESMSDHGIRRVPACNDDELVGISTVDDLTELLADEQQQLANVIKAQRPPY